jgi:hypothetical protein
MLTESAQQRRVHFTLAELDAVRWAAEVHNNAGFLDKNPECTLIDPEKFEPWNMFDVEDILRRLEDQALAMRNFANAAKRAAKKIRHARYANTELQQAKGNSTVT